MADQLPFVRSNDIQSNSAALRQRVDEQGYLFFKGLGPKDKLLAARRDVTARLANAGWIEATDPMAAKWSGAGPFTEGDPAYMAVYRDVIHLPSFLAVPDDAVFKRLLSAIVGGEATCHRLRIGRITFPGNVSQTTAPHQDFHYIRGSADTFTVWQPLGDCPLPLGPLAVLPQSHRGGFIAHRENKAKKYASMGLDDDQMPAGNWRCEDFELGDFVLFHSHTIHKAMPNLTPDRLRLSTDNRYQKTGEAMSPVSQGSHYNL